MESRRCGGFGKVPVVEGCSRRDQGSPAAMLFRNHGTNRQGLPSDFVDLEAPVEGAADFFGIREHPLSDLDEGEVASRFPFREEAFGGCLAASAEDGDSALFEADKCGGGGLAAHVSSPMLHPHLLDY